MIRETAEVVATRLSALPEGTRLLIGFDMPVVASAPMASTEPEPEDEDASGDTAEAEAAAPQPVLPDLVDSVAETIASLRRKGFGRLYVDGKTVNLDDVDTATLKDWPVLQVIVDRVKVDVDARVRLTDSIETAYTEGGGAAFAIEADGGRIAYRFSERFECRTCNIPYQVPQPRLFSFNNPFGACPQCHGFGNIIELDMALVVPDQTKSIQQNAIEPWSKPHYSRATRRAEARREEAVRLDAPWTDSTRTRSASSSKGTAAAGRASRVSSAGWSARGHKVHVRVFLSRYRGYLTCPECNGARLRRKRATSASASARSTSSAA